MGDPVDVLTRAEPSAVRITDHSGRTRVIEDPWVDADSVFSDASSCRSEACRALRPAGAALHDIQGLEVPGDRDYTLLYAAVGAVALIGWLAYESLEICPLAC